MSEQALDLRRYVRIVRRHRLLIGIVTALGLLLGAGYSVLKPPMLTSTVLVVLPRAIQNTGAPASPGPDSYMATQIVIAGSDPVLSKALPHISPHASLQALRREVQAKSLTDSVLSISAMSKTAAQAEAIANAVANSYIAYVGSARIPGGSVHPYVLQPATNATAASPIQHLLVDTLIGAIVGALIGIIAALAISRTDRRLRERDEIAATIGIPVLASLAVAHPTDASGWTKLLEDYEPGALQALRLRQALQQLGMAGGAASNGHRAAASSLCVLSLSSDPGALALGPQLAVFAASLGIPTTLVVGPQQDATAAATLRTACAVPPAASSKRPSHLRVTVSDDIEVDGQSDAMLTIVVTVVDGQAPQMADLIPTTSTVLGVSAGVATAEQLAKVVSSAAANGREITGILVADPEPTDHTSGRIPHVIHVATTQTAQAHDGRSNTYQHDADDTVIFAKLSDNLPDLPTEMKRLFISDKECSSCGHSRTCRLITPGGRRAMYAAIHGYVIARKLAAG